MTNTSTGNGRKKAQNAQKSIGRPGIFLRLLRFFAAIGLHVHHFIALPLENEGAAPTIDPSHTIAIKRWAREYLKLPESSVVSVNEFACRDPGCPLLETVISVFAEGGGARVWKLTRPRIAVTKTMIHQTLAMPPTVK